MSAPAAIAVAVLLLAGNAFFVGAEFALISARRSRIEPLAEQGHRRARTTLAAMEQVSLMMACAQLGITVCSLGLGAVGEPAVAHLVEPLFEAAGLPEQLVHPFAFAVALSVVVYLHMVLGEMVPKNIALAGPERSAMLLGPPLLFTVRVLRPVIWLVNGLANLALRALRVQARDEVASAFTTEEVASMIAESRREGLLDPDEHELLSGALQFQVRRAADLLVRDLVTVPVDATPDDVEELVAATGFSRFPVVGADGGLLGYVHVKDVVQDEVRDPADAALSRWVRPLPPIPGDAPVEDAVTILRRAGSHLGTVVDADDGRTLGVLALEDALEELIGEVQDAAHRNPP